MITSLFGGGLVVLPKTRAFRNKGYGFSNRFLAEFILEQSEGLGMTFRYFLTALFVRP